jgi:hypothetical protein
VAEPNQTLRVGESGIYSRPTEWWLIMNSRSLREKAALCLRIAQHLSWNNPSRLQLADLADRLERQAKEIEAQDRPAREGSLLASAVRLTKS